MINLEEVSRQLDEQDTALRVELATSAGHIGDPDLRAVAVVLAAGMQALHERQGSAILLMLRSAS